MKAHKLTLRPLTHFGTPLAGDTLFGHLCWALRERFGTPRLTEALDGYTDGRPFLSVSDALPAGYVPRPTAPNEALGITIDPEQRKTAREFNWLPVTGAALPLREWLGTAAKCEIAEAGVLTQNTINRLTGTTGTGMFAPRQVDRTAFRANVLLDVYAACDEARLSAADLRALFEDVGAVGFGRDASTGLGKFAVEHRAEHVWPAPPTCHWLTLAPCAPEPDLLDPERSFYQPLTRFGRHGNVAVRLGQPFKRPLLMLRTGALLRLREPGTLVVHGRGLGGRAAPLSAVLPETVHQGYAPVLPLQMESST